MFVFTLLLAIGVCGAAADDVVPNYNKIVQDYKEAKRLLTEYSTPEYIEMIPDWTLPSKQRDYIQLVAFLDTMTNKFYRNTPYEDVYYDVLNQTVPYAWKDPTNVLMALQELIRKVDAATSSVEDLVNKYCGISRGNDVECNTFVDLEIKKDPQYQPGYETIKALGKVVETYVKEPYNAKANNYDMVSFLLNSKDEIQPLVEQLRHLRDVMSRLY